MINYYKFNIYDPIKYLDEHNWSYSDKTTDIKSSCDYCTNNPKNGGSGICHCIVCTDTAYMLGTNIAY